MDTPLRQFYALLHRVRFTSEFVKPSEIEAVARALRGFGLELFAFEEAVSLLDRHVARHRVFTEDFAEWLQLTPPEVRAVLTVKEGVYSEGKQAVA